jgi:hypothetical protein
MIITDRFVFIHQPKTGGTFVREALWEISRREARSFPRGILQRAGLVRPLYACFETDDYHGSCHAIPAVHRKKQILSIVRNPFDFYVSFYHFGWWASHPEDSYRDLDAVKRAFPHFPDLSFEEFLALANHHFNEFDMIGSPMEDVDQRLGYYSTQFVLYFFKNPRAVYRAIDDEYIGGARWTGDMFDVHFMRTHSLNRDLHRYLSDIGYRKSLIDGVSSKSPVRPTEQLRDRPSREYEHYYTDSSRELVLRKEKLLFALFPDLRP